MLTPPEMAISSSHNSLPLGADCASVQICFWQTSDIHHSLHTTTKPYRRDKKLNN